MKPQLVKTRICSLIYCRVGCCWAVCPDSLALSLCAGCTLGCHQAIPRLVLELIADECVQFDFDDPACAGKKSKDTVCCSGQGGKDLQ